jgi:dTMP kinase
MRGKLILIEGTDCSGKQTQSELLIKRLTKSGKKVSRLSFPMYDTPTGKIIGGPYLGKNYISESWFKEGANNVNPFVSSLYYTIDRVYNISKVTDLLDNGITVVLDRYIPSNMAHHGGKIEKRQERLAFYNFIDTLEYNMLGLPKPDFVYFLHLPYEYGKQLRDKRTGVEKLDEHEKSELNLRNAEMAYLEISEIYNFKVINCINGNEIRSIEDINDELYSDVLQKI